MKNNVYAHRIYHIAQDNFVFRVICLDTGTQTQNNVKAANKMHILIQVEEHVLTVQKIVLYGMVTNASLVQRAQITTQNLEDVNYVHLDSVSIKCKGNAHALNRLHTYTRTVLVLIASRHIFGINKQNHAMHVLWHTFMTFLWPSALALSTPHMKETKYALPATSHSSGTNRPHNVKSVRPRLFTIRKWINVSVHWILLMNTMEDA